jgi:hypothetical protein
MISTKYPSNSSLTSDDEVEIVAISTNVAGKKPFIMIYGDQTVQSTNFHSGALEITETQMLLPDPDFEPEIKIEEITETAESSKAPIDRMDQSDQFINRPDRSIISINHDVSHSVNQSTDQQSIDRPTNQPFNRSDNLSTNRSSN